MFYIIFKILDIANKMHGFIAFILFVKCCYSYAACPSLLSTETRDIICKYESKTLDNCITPIEGRIACLSCKKYYEEITVVKNPCFLCNNGSWGAAIPNCYPICGKLNEVADPDSDVPLKYPWHVGIYKKNQELLCSGTLISMNVVLTGAHCFVSSNKKAFETGEIFDVFVAAGKNYQEYLSERDKLAQYSKVINRIKLPAQLYGLTFDNNIVLLVMTDPFLPSDVVRPICVDFYPKLENVILPTNGLTTNWIFTYRSKFRFGVGDSTVLQEIPLTFIPCSECIFQSSFGVKKCLTTADTNSDIFYVGGSGGAVVFKNSIDERYYVAGIYSIQSQDTSKNCSMYSSTDAYLNFLEAFITNYRIRYCEIPQQPQHGKYAFIGTEGYRFEYGVKPLSVILLTCNAGYSTSSRENYFTCSNDGQWTPTLGDCTRVTQLDDNNMDVINKPVEFDYGNISLIVAVIIFFIVAIALGILLKLKFNKKKKLRRELKMAGLHCFQFGNLKRFNPELGIDSQAEFLPYNNNYEFPRDKLELGQQLGSGAFGIVLKADAFGIISNQEKTTVAVKTVKSIVDDIHMKALVSELKIMIHLGQHLNVVNLLGACTQNIIKRELLVIVEYCQFGNLYNYLLQNRSNYIDQIDSVTENVDYSCGLEDVESVPAVYHNTSTSQEADLNNISLLNKNDKLIYTKDLISWSFQIARGMEYLTSRKIFHGDLAARNILLAENNIVKICDFGLAKRIYRTANYKKNKDCPLPFKWMAIESIRDLVFSTQSDVWSYGIVLWELFSLAQTPYPGMEPDEQLYQKLLEGYRMESPSHAPKGIYKIMCDCWNSEPLSRPCFNKLAGRVGLLLEENIRHFYIDLNDPYFAMNTARLAEDQNDFLVMLSAPGATETPKYLSVKLSNLLLDQDENIADNEPNMIVNNDQTK